MIDDHVMCGRARDNVTSRARDVETRIADSDKKILTDQARHGSKGDERGALHISHVTQAQTSPSRSPREISPRGKWQSPHRGMLDARPTVCDARANRHVASHGVWHRLSRDQGSGSLVGPILVCVQLSASCRRLCSSALRASFGAASPASSPSRAGGTRKRSRGRMASRAGWR